MTLPHSLNGFCVQNVFKSRSTACYHVVWDYSAYGFEDVRDCHETVMNFIVKFHFHPISPMKNKSGAYGARTRNLRRDRAAL